jgi:transposase
LVTAASVQDTTGGRDVVSELAARHPAVVKAWVDSGYKRSVIETGASHGIEVEVVSKDPGQKGFAPLPKRWAVERTFGWWMLHRRLVRDYQTLPERSATMIYWAMIDNMGRRLTSESTQTWHDGPDETGEPSVT